MAVDQHLLFEQTCTWIYEGIGAVQGVVPEAEDLYYTQKAEVRLQFIRSALRVTLLEEYESARQGLAPARATLGALGITVAEADTQTAEEEPDRLLIKGGL